MSRACLPDAISRPSSGARSRRASRRATSTGSACSTATPTRRSPRTPWRRPASRAAGASRGSPRRAGGIQPAPGGRRRVRRTPRVLGARRAPAPATAK
ncbi:hypothetical protein CF641_37825, partial [Burkholderia pseudomallei]